MGKRYMTLDDLYNFYFSQGQNQTFSCNDDNSTIVVRTNGQMIFSKSEATDGLYPTRVQMNFIGDNLNGSRIEMKAQEAALSSSHYRPLLAYIHEVDGEPQFYGHNMHQDENGEIVYDEQPIGVIAEEAHIEHDDEYDMDYAVALGYIWEEYSKAAYIIERDKKCDVSVELSIRSLSYDAKDGVLVLDDFYYSGCSILGYDEEGNKVNPAMPGSNITLADFSAKNNSIVDSDRLSQTLDKLNELLSKFDINTLRKEETTKVQENELLEQFEDETKKIIPDDDVVEEENLEEKPDEEETPTTPIEPDEDQDDEEDVPENEEDDSEDNDDETDSNETFEEKINCSVKIGERIKEFSVSMNAKIEALSQLVNDTYADDMTWYCVECFDEDKTVVMIDCWTGKAYRQSYKVKEDVFSLKGDRVAVHSMWVTDDEQKAFENMKASFESVTEKLTKYETEPEKMEIINNEEYSQIFETKEFEDFSKQESHFDLSVDEVKEKMDEMLLAYAKSGSLTFSSTTTQEVGMKKLPIENKKSSRYGSLFSKH